jgi:Sec7-like guanine-nucleotide exchange factor
VCFAEPKLKEKSFFFQRNFPNLNLKPFGSILPLGNPDTSQLFRIDCLDFASTGMLESLRLALRHVEVGRALYVCHLTGMADGWGW